MSAGLVGLGGVGLSFVLTDCSNGVTRISDASLSPLHPYPPAGWARLDFPLSASLLDAADASLGSLIAELFAGLLVGHAGRAGGCDLAAQYVGHLGLVGAVLSACAWLGGVRSCGHRWPGSSWLKGR